MISERRFELTLSILHSVEKSLCLRFGPPGFTTSLAGCEVNTQPEAMLAQ